MGKTNSVDILIKNGHVVDPSQNIDKQTNLSIKNGKIYEVGDCSSAESKLTFDADGMFIVPGFIDFHSHIYKSASDFCAAPDSFSFACGTTTMVDAGSAGTANYEGFRTYASTQLTRIKSLLNVCPTGLGTLKYHENVDPKIWDRQKIKSIYDAHRDNFIGLKIRQSAYVVNNMGLAPLEEAIKLSKEVDCRVVVHVTDPPCEQYKIADMLRKDDVFCHVFQGTGKTVIENGKVHPCIKAARERGVLFDASNGMGHFNFEVAEKALSDGFLPDILSTDITVNSLYKDYVVALPHLMSKYLYLGVSLYDTVKMVTQNPAKAMYMQDKIGTLKAGAEADVVIFQLKEMNVSFKDTQGNIRTGSKMIVPKMTLQGGEIRFRSFDYFM
ncbi:MAG: amidohydrolase family protein [Synergistes jonesii]|uniref:amidohydrolase family protein n=1 Tax=Synergistes jonesii TaxID=2754 RepID=UPI002A762625|nr:amidohydrolase family protein [Synergistes jonesii]MDY2984993.1 amidohydrolase family protein [Synergistes jonesii]